MSSTEKKKKEGEDGSSVLYLCASKVDRICGWKKRGKSLLLCLPLTQPKERGGLNEWALMLRDPDTWAHTGSLFVAHACLGLPVFCGPMTMNLGSLSQVFSLDQMSLCRLSSHGFCRGTGRGIRDLSDYIHLMCTDTHIKNAHTYVHSVHGGFTAQNEWGYCVTHQNYSQPSHYRHMSGHKGPIHLKKNENHLKHIKTCLNQLDPETALHSHINTSH